MSRLSENIIPINYNLLFEPNFKSFTFTGRALIQIRIRSSVSSIVLNAKELKIARAFLQHKKDILHPKVHLDNEKEVVVLKFNKTLHSDSYLLTLEFEGKLNDDLRGFYRSKYQEAKKTKYLATTQMEAPYARYAFPCFDQPDMKATFDVSLSIDKNLSAVSNMPAIYEEIQNGKKLIKFDRTPMMSTYLLYMGVGEFEYLHDTYDKRVRLRAVTTKGKSKQGKFVLDLTKKFLKYFEDYSEIPYPLPKLDLLAIPDFAAGAMENWGAITFREILLLFDEKKTSTRIKKRIAEVLAHELWHQWSGNLVTMEWWDDLWLNESFATYMAFKAVSHYFPEWNMWEDFVEGETEGAFAADMLKTTHPIAVSVSTPNQVEEIFDEISYGKGGSVLRMIDSYLTHEVFRKGVSNYLKKYKYKNAKAQDLWNSIAEVSDAPIKEVMESWINQPGFPLLSISKKSNKILLQQKRFNSHSNQTWKIPIVLKSDTKTDRFLLQKRKEKLRIKARSIKANLDQEGFYRVKYSQDLLESLKPLITQKKLSSFDRWGIQNDLFALAVTGEISLDHYLNFIKAYENEDSYFVLANIYGNLYQIYYLFSSHPIWDNIWPKFSQIMSKPFRKQFQRLKWVPKKKEKVNDALLRPLCISYFSFIGDEKIISQGMKKLNLKLPPDIEGAVFSLAALNGGKVEYSKLTKKYESEKIVERKVKLLSSLYRFKSPEILETALNYSQTNKVRTQDLRTVFSIILSNPSTKKIIFHWMKKHWVKLKEFEKTHFVFMGILEALIISHTDRKTLAEISHFLKTNKIKYEKTRANAFEIAQINSSFIQRNLKVLENYFK